MEKQDKSMTQRPTLIVTVGLPGMGKSTWARNLEADGWVRVSSDAVRAQLLGGHEEEKPYDLKNEDEVWGIVEEHVRNNLRMGRNVVMDSTALTRRSRDNFRCWATLEGAEVIFVTFPFNKHLMYLRREHLIPRETLDAMVERYEPVGTDEGATVKAAIDTEVVA